MFLRRPKKSDVYFVLSSFFITSLTEKTSQITTSKSLMFSGEEFQKPAFLNVRNCQGNGQGDTFPTNAIGISDLYSEYFEHSKMRLSILFLHRWPTADSLMSRLQSKAARVLSNPNGKRKTAWPSMNSQCPKEQPQRLFWTVFQPKSAQVCINSEKITPKDKAGCS